MTDEKRKTKWAVPVGKRQILNGKGQKIFIREILPFGGHGGGGIETGAMQEITISDVEVFASNMMKVQTEEEDYYMYNYSFPNKSLMIPARAEWIDLDTPQIPLIGERITLARRCKQNNFKGEVFHTNPVLSIEVLNEKMVIAWCKDKEVGQDMGYVLNVKDANPAPKCNAYWLWNIGCQRPNQREDMCYITIDIEGDIFSADIGFTPKSAQALGDATLFEGEDGNFYIAKLPISSCWKK